MSEIKVSQTQTAVEARRGKKKSADVRLCYGQIRPQTLAGSSLSLTKKIAKILDHS